MDAPYSHIIATLDRLSAPPGDTIAERIEGLHRELAEAGARVILAEREKAQAALREEQSKTADAMAALNAADVFTTGTLAHGIAYLAEQRNIATSRAIAAERATVRERQCAEQARAQLARST